MNGARNVLLPSDNDNNLLRGRKKNKKKEEEEFLYTNSTAWSKVLVVV